jgi:hypothetical protein
VFSQRIVSTYTLTINERLRRGFYSVLSLELIRFIACGELLVLDVKALALQ